MRVGWIALCAAVVVASCFATAPDGIHRETDQGGAGGNGFTTGSSSSSSSTSSSGSNDPHAVLGADPAHGPFNGGQHVVIHGKGFQPNVQVWFGEVAAIDPIAIDPGRVQVTAPPGDPGPVDVSAQNGEDSSTLRTLPGGYSYDALWAQPSSGPVAGGTVITIFGKATAWDQDLIEADIDDEPCTTLDVVSPTELSCTVPKGTPGTKPISVVTSQGTTTALDAYTYQDSSDGFKGGLSGGPLAGHLQVLVYDNFVGDPIAGAHVIVGSSLATGLYQQADATGVALFDDPSLTQPATVTVAAECHSPVSFVDVPVDAVTVYLNPTLTPSCAGKGDPPPTGGNPTLQGVVAGELVWPNNQEFQKGEWVNVPPPSTDEARIAYVFVATRYHQNSFSLPSSSFSVTEQSPGDLGYGFQIPVYPGNQALYAIAGLRNTKTGVFYGYVFGAVSGVAVFPGQLTDSVIIRMRAALDQALVLDPSPPAPGPKGPDRLQATVAVEIAHDAYAILPGAQKEPLLPITAPLSFVGVPPLDGDLTGARYITDAAAVTGPSHNAPESVVRAVASTTTSVPVTISDFVALPGLLTPALNTAWNGTQLAVSYGSGGLPPDMSVYDIVAGSGLVRWLVAVPQADHAIELPDLSGFENAGLPPGPVVIGIYGAHIVGFDYASLRYRDMRPSGMDAYSLDYFNTHL